MSDLYEIKKGRRVVGLQVSPFMVWGVCWAHIFLDCMDCDQSIGLKFISNAEATAMSDEEATRIFEAQGWTVSPTRCPKCAAKQGEPMYDCTQDVEKHQRLVRTFLSAFTSALEKRGLTHDQSKLSDPSEKMLFDHWTPELRRRTFGSDEYKQALDSMGEGVQRHYRANRHHPEHYKNGVNDMTLVDVMEMLADWMAAAQRNHTYVDLDTAAKRFGLAPQLVEILANTLREEDLLAVRAGFRYDLCPPDRRDGPVEGFVRPGEEE